MSDDTPQEQQLVLVPLDGSELSEAALPYAAQLAKLMNARVLLLTVWEEGERALLSGAADYADIFKRGEEAHEAYVGAKARALEAQGLSVDAEVRIGDPSDEVLRMIGQRDPALLVLSTHGRSGLGRWMYGSVASRLVREAPVPTLLVGARVLERTDRSAAIKRILVPLDGSPLSESALKPAAELAAACGGELILAEALQWQAQAITFGVADIDMSQVMTEMEKAADAYLSKVQESFATKQPVTTKVVRGRPADALLNLVDSEGVDLVLMASHTRGPLGRAVLGSVADRMIQGAAPVLLVRPGQPAGTGESVRGWYCHNCGRASPFIDVLPEDVCPRCGQSLHACGNCVYFDGIECLLKRPEVHDTYPGRDCPYFQFRQTTPSAAPAAKGGKSR